MIPVNTAGRPPGEHERLPRYSPKLFGTEPLFEYAPVPAVIRRWFAWVRLPVAVIGLLPEKWIARRLAELARVTYSANGFPPQGIALQTPRGLWYHVVDATGTLGITPLQSS